MSTAADPRPEIGRVDLALPEDLFDLLAPEDDDEAHVVLGDLVAATFPRMDAGAQESMVAGLIAWRAHLRTQGVLTHSIAAIPADESRGAVHWHVFAGVVELPTHPDIDTAELLARILGQGLTEERAYVEAFETRMGRGVGVITSVDLVADTSTAARMPAGLTLAISSAPGAAQGLLVVGLSLDLEAHLQLAAIVAAAAAASVIHLDADGALPDRS